MTFVKHENGVWYPACPNESCSGRKVLQNGDVWQCEKCQQTYQQCNYRYMMNMLCMDHTGQQWLTAFDPCGASVLGKSAQEVVMLRDTNPAAYEALFEELLFKQFVFRVKVEST